VLGDHSMILSARIMTALGIGTPRDLLVLRFRTYSNLVGCSTGGVITQPNPARPRDPVHWGHVTRRFNTPSRSIVPTSTGNHKHQQDSFRFGELAGSSVVVECLLGIALKAAQSGQANKGRDFFPPMALQPRRQVRSL
jgi:hypothetical protein